jgi:hypothetical protein
MSNDLIHHDPEILKAFLKWFHDLEGFHFKAERFYDDIQSGQPLVAREWLIEAFKQGYEAAKTKGSTQGTPET